MPRNLRDTSFFDKKSSEIGRTATQVRDNVSFKCQEFLSS